MIQNENQSADMRRAMPDANLKNILIASSVDPAAIDILRKKHRVTCAYGAPEEELCALVRDCDVLVFRSGVQITGKVLRAAPRLKLLVRAGSGLDNLDMPAVEQLALRLVRVPEPGAQAVAELSFALMLMLARQLRTADSLLRKGHWAKNQLTGYLLSGKRLGIIGAGNIGARVGTMASAWGMEPVGCVENPSPRTMADLAARNMQLMDMDEVLSTSDFISIHVPLKDSTRGLIGARALAQMKPGAFLVNLARGGVVDEDALYLELKAEHRLAGAALDVHAAEGEGRISPLAELDNVILTPHIGATTIDTQRQIGERIIEIVGRAASRCELNPVVTNTTIPEPPLPLYGSAELN